jgi:hypothetical protein
MSKTIFYTILLVCAAVFLICFGLSMVSEMFVTVGEKITAILLVLLVVAPLIPLWHYNEKEDDEE